MKRIKVKWEYPACNLCGSGTNEVVWDKVTSWMNRGVFRIVSCSECGLTYLSPRPAASLIKKYYQPESYWGRNILKFAGSESSQSREGAYEFLYKDIFEMRKNGSILDIGAGTGLFLKRFKEKDWKIEGVELSKEACKFAKKMFGIDLKSGDFLDQNFAKRSFNLVTLNSSLEHLYRPKETLAKIWDVLTKRGLLVITVPNIDSFGARIFGKEWYALQPPTHLYHFTPKTLSSMLFSTGFKVKSIKHSYWQHNYHIIFESARMLFSPKFKKSSDGGLVDKGTLTRKSKQSLLLVSAKIAVRAAAFLTALLEPIFSKGEVISVYAEKT